MKCEEHGYDGREPSRRIAACVDCCRAYAAGDSFDVSRWARREVVGMLDELALNETAAGAEIDRLKAEVATLKGRHEAALGLEKGATERGAAKKDLEIAWLKADISRWTERYGRACRDMRSLKEAEAEQEAAKPKPGRIDDRLKYIGELLERIHADTQVPGSFSVPVGGYPTHTPWSISLPLPSSTDCATHG